MQTASTARCIPHGLPRHATCHATVQGRSNSGSRPREEPDKFSLRELKNSAFTSANAKRLKMTVAYDGTGFAGFQLQAGKVRTVQGELEKAAQKVFMGCSRMVGASRTDAGAHAYGQVVHFDVIGNRDNLDTDLMFFNASLPQDVKATALEYAPEGFDSHFRCIGKTYEYYILTGIPDPLQSSRQWWTHQRHVERSRGPPLRPSDMHLDVAAMQEAAEQLLGTHDFTAFMDSKRPPGRGAVMKKRPKTVATGGVLEERTTDKNIRTLGELCVQQVSSSTTTSQSVRISVTGDGFLYHMVRMLAAGLLEVGAGRMKPTQIRKCLEAGDRSVLPDAAPPHGLYLMQVWYPETQELMLQRCSQAVGLNAMLAALSPKSKSSDINGSSDAEEVGTDEGVLMTS